MTIHRTPKGITEDLQVLCGEQLRMIAKDTGQSLAMVAAAVGRDPSTVEDWANAAKSLPVYMLAHPSVSRSLRLAYVGWLVRRLEADAPQTSCEQSTCNAMREAGELIAVIAPMLVDGRIDDAEKRVLRPLVARLARLLNAWLAQHGGDEVSE